MRTSPCKGRGADQISVQFSRPGPHISRLMVDNQDAVLDHAQSIVIGNPDPDFWNVLNQLRNGQSIVDFVRITDLRSENGRYDDVC
jgi:hypothetical protein